MDYNNFFKFPMFSYITFNEKFAMKYNIDVLKVDVDKNSKLLKYKNEYYI